MRDSDLVLAVRSVTGRELVSTGLTSLLSPSSDGVRVGVGVGVLNCSLDTGGCNSIIRQNECHVRTDTAAHSVSQSTQQDPLFQNTN